MNEMTRTGAFVGGAILSLLLATVLAPSAPKAPDEFADVGKLFYEEFDALQARSLKVVSFNDETATSRTFEVDFKDGLWRIPSHHNYPADAKDRLARTAASVLTIRKDEFRTSNKDDYPELGVVDPLDEDTTKLKGRGQRITIRDEAGKVLADYIIGKQVKNRSGFYYVRQPDQKSVYVSKLNIDLSTKFSDWIETNLLNLGSGQLRDIVVNKYSIDQEKGAIVGTEVSELTRDKAGDPWKLKGLSEDKEELNTADINTMLSTLEDLRIVGVRPKPAGLSRDLKQDGAIKIDPLTMADLQSRGFFFARGGQLVSQEGEVLATTNDGVTYVLRFGEVFAGTENEAETGVGNSAAAVAEKTEEKKDEAAEGEQKPEEKKSSLTENRYVFISATFDESKLGPKPEKPTAPPEPAKEEKKEEAKPAEGETKPEEKPSETPSVDPMSEELKQKYEAELAKYETDLADWDKRKKEGEERAAELNRRFADWYYVISTESFNKLRLSRAALVKEKTAAPPAEPQTGTPPTVTPQTPESEKAETDKPASEETTPEKPAEGTSQESATPESETPSEEKQAEEKPVSEKPAESPETETPTTEDKPADAPSSEQTPPATEEKK